MNNAIMQNKINPLDETYVNPSLCRNYQTVERHYLPNNEKIMPDFLVVYTQLLDNKYSVLDMLGKGSFGQVVLARDNMTNRNVAIKILHAKKSMHSICCEIETLKILNENNQDNLFVRLLGDFAWLEFHCLVFELLGENLFEYLRKRNYTGMPFFNVIEIAYQLTTALYYLNNLHIVHCDIKPENIAFTNQGNKVKLIDFGSSCTDGKPLYRYIQSRFYRAVEVILELGYNFKIDTWSVGCVLVELVTGTPLFPGNNEHEQIAYFLRVLGGIPQQMLAASSKFMNFFYIRNNITVLKPLGKTFNVKKCTLESLIYESSSIRSLFINPLNSTAYQIHVNLFINFVSSMLIYNPTQRAHPYDLLSHQLLSKFNSPSSMTGTLNRSPQTIMPTQLVNPLFIDSNFQNINYQPCNIGPSYNQLYLNHYLNYPSIPYVVQYPIPVQLRLAPSNNIVKPPNILPPGPSLNHISTRPPKNPFAHCMNDYIENSGIICSCPECLISLNPQYYCNS